MVTFSTDSDILKYEPGLFGELYLPGQVLALGTGAQLSGTTLTATGADFVSARVSAGGVVYLRSSGGLLDGAYEVVSVDSATQLTVSVVRAAADDEPVAPPPATQIKYRVSTFAPQAAEAAFQLTEALGVKPGNPASNIDAKDILCPDVLKRASVFAVISSVYAMLASKARDDNFWKKSLHYQSLLEKARLRFRVGIDLGSDGLPDVTISGASGRLKRD